ncbi:MAG TPA: tRNA lysidine(34) synthetase TilS [Stellaceae bacterium]|jgi:tRNA(Ile)-lysidine synthase|nr:tRNA lysidine(34) synthetase TilS [Stellaceae bacterium]
MGASAPLTTDEFTKRLDRIGGFEPRPIIAVALSGGPDSMALAILAHCWARDRGGAVQALTVDHGLRPESLAEARQVAAWLAVRGIAHETLVWAVDKPKSGIQEAARAARYRLLAGWCAAHGVLHLLTAHQREDQAETYLIRRRAGSGVDGLAGMSVVRELAGCRLLRPLLDVPRVRLVAFLTEERQPFLDDPSNRNPSYERTRLRSQTDASIGAAISETQHCASVRIDRETALDALLARSVGLHPAGFAVLDREAIGATPDDIAERLLARVAACIGALHYPPRRDRIARLRQALVAAPERARTLGGCRFLLWRGRILVLRELAAAAPPVRLNAGEEVWWDRRFAVSLPAATPASLTLGYLGSRGCPDGEQPATLPRLLRPILPAVWDESGRVSIPHLASGDDRGWAGDLRIAFRPANPLTGAGFTVV